MLGRGRKWMHMLLADTALPPQGYSIKQCNGFYNTTGNNQDFPWITGHTKGDKRSLANPKQRQKISPSCCRKGMKSSATVPARAWLDDPETTWWLRLPIPEGKTCLINAQTFQSLHKHLSLSLLRLDAKFTTNQHLSSALSSFLHRIQSPSLQQTF